jgi:hypothetical protein
VSARTVLTLCAVLSGASLASAQLRISPGDMAGRERERFIESPAERFMRPGPYVEPPVIEGAPKPIRRKLRRARSKNG